MRIAAFYENIKEGTEYLGISMKEACMDLKEAGMELLYISGSSFQEDRDEVIQLLKETELKIEGLHQWVDFAHNPESEEYKQTLKDAKMLGAANVLFVPGFIRDEEESQREYLIMNMIKGMSHAVAYGEKIGMPVSMEDFDGMSAPYNCISGLKRFMDEIPGLKCSFDTGNFIMYHENEMDAFACFNDRLCTIHLKDRKATPYYAGNIPNICADGSRSYSCPIGDGNIHIEELIARLQGQNYEGNLIVEMYGCDPKHMLEGIRQSILHVKAML